MKTDYSKVSEVKLTYSTKVRASERYSITSPDDLYKFLRNYVFDPETIELRESFKLILLNRANKVLGFSSLFEGGISSTVADIRMIMQTALLANACSIIVAHNHPSGQLKASDADKQITTKIKEAGAFLDITLLDHIIVTTADYFSLANEGLL
nr:JAB domain-containing protein [uncultured Draconibacterium sp.]